MKLLTKNIFLSVTILLISGGIITSIIIMQDYSFNIVTNDQYEIIDMWNFHDGECFESSPVVANIDNDNVLEVVIADYNGWIYALNGINGKIKWSRDLENKLFSTPAVGDINNDGKMEVVIGGMPTRTFPSSGVFAINGTNGEIIWTVTMNGHVYSSPAIGDINNDGKMEVVIGSTSGSVLAINGTSGTKLWEFKTPNGPASIKSSPAIGDINNDGIIEIVVGYDNSYLYAINGINGSLIWSFQWGGRFFSSPALGDIDNDGELEIVFGSSNHYLYALNGENGSLLWIYKTGGVIESSPALADIDEDGKLEVVIGCHDYKVYAINGEDGSLLWNYTTFSSHIWFSLETQGVFTSPAIGDLNGDGILDIIVGRRSSGLVYAIHGKKGTLLWYYYVSSGAERWGYFLSIDTSPAISDVDNDGNNEVFFGTTNGHFFALKAHGSIIAWPMFGGTSQHTRNIENFNRDGDGLLDYIEKEIGTSVNSSDTDGDGIPDHFEVYFGTNPLENDSNVDSDGDGLKNIDEYKYGTNPRSIDTDGDWVPDSWEVAIGYNPIRPDILEWFSFYGPLIILSIVAVYYFEKRKIQKTHNIKDIAR